jgi:hypothetical protein
MKTMVRLCCLILFWALVAGCSSVKPYQKEHLADPIMQLSQEEELREQKWLEAREGSTGGAGGAGGGCACR